MKFYQLLAGISLASCLATGSYAGLAGFQAGNILAQSPPYSINQDSGIASYYADGTSGRIEFSCDLEGDKSGPAISAFLTPGKNFDNQFNAHYIPLNVGINGPFTWTLTDTGETTGNIKVAYQTGQNVTIQCQGKLLNNNEAVTKKKT